MIPHEAQARYEANVRKIAEEMARETFKGVWRPPNAIPEWESLVWESLVIADYIRDYLPLARIAVKHMAEEVVTLMTGKFLWSTIQTYLQERGLVPVKTEQ